MKTLTFLHSGKGGDCIASLSFVKFICEKEQAKAIFFLDCTGGLTSGDEETNNIVNRQTGNKGLNFPKSTCEFLKPLIEAQEYVSEVHIYDGGTELPKIDYNLNKFRLCFIDQTLVQKSMTNLEYAHYEAFGYDHPKTLVPWLKIPTSQVVYSSKPIVIARTPRYTSAHLWIASQEHILKNEAVFLGTEFEHRVFQECFDFAPEYRKVKEALEAASILAGSDTVIANGTLLYWIAVGLHNANIIHEVGVDIPTTVYPGELPNISYIQGGRMFRRLI